MKEAARRLVLNPLRLSILFYSCWIALLLIQVGVEFLLTNQPEAQFTAKSVIRVLQWVFLLLAIPVTIGGKKGWSVQTSLLLVGSLLLACSMLLRTYAGLLASSGILIWVAILLYNCLPPIWSNFQRSYREIRKEENHNIE